MNSNLSLKTFKSCADPADVNVIKSNTMQGCVGACIVYNLAGS